MKRISVLILTCFILFNAVGQKVFEVDTSKVYYNLDEYGPKGEVHRVHEDSSGWKLYKIEKDSFYYFQLISYGEVYENGFSYAMGHIQTDFKTTRYLMPGSYLHDTIPTPLEYITYDDKKKKWKYWTEYRVGGMFGVHVRSSKPYYKK